MSDGLKIALVLGGAGLVAFVFYEHEKHAAAAAGVPSVPGTGSALAPAPGTGSTAAAPHSTSLTSGLTSLAGKGIAFAATTPIRVASTVVGVGVSTVKSIGGDVYGALKSIF